jgi:post-segregation antitoxin (ccd killing protein)
MDFTKYFPLEKMEESVDGQTLHVYGLVTEEKPDLDNEVCDYETSKPMFQKFAQGQLKRTSLPGMTPSLMPLREMHQTITQGAGRALDFDDAEKAIHMGFDVIDPTAIKKWKAGCFVGFSQGGDYVKKWTDPVFKGCVRYTSNPIEVSAVDVPCLPSALVETMKGRTVELHKAAGGIEMVKLGVVKDSDKSDDKVEELGKAVEALRAMIEGLAEAKAARTKRVADEDLPPSSFAYVGDPEKPETWKLPIKFSTEEKTKAHIRNALARFGQTQGIPAGEKAKVRAKIVAAARKYGIGVSEDGKKALSVAMGKASIAAAEGTLEDVMIRLQWIALQKQEKIEVDSDLADDAKLFDVEVIKAATPARRMEQTMD